MPRVARRPSGTAVDPAKRKPSSAALLDGHDGISEEFLDKVRRWLVARKAGQWQPRKAHGAHSPLGHVRRPQNSFMTFRSAVNDCQDDSGGAQQSVSRRAGVLWPLMPDDIRHLCQEIASAEALKHREQYPDYKYSPRARTDRRPPTAPKPKSRGRKKAADDNADDDYVGHDLELYLPERPTLRARSGRAVVVDEDEEDEEDEEEMTVTGGSDVSSVSGATAVSTYSDSDRESTATAPASPSPTASSLSLSEPASACTPATTVLAEEGGDAFEAKVDPAISNLPAFAHEGNSTPRPAHDAPGDVSPLRPGCSASIFLASPPLESSWPMQHLAATIAADLDKLALAPHGDSPLATFTSSSGFDALWSLSPASQLSSDPMEIDPYILDNPDVVPANFDLNHFMRIFPRILIHTPIAFRYPSSIRHPRIASVLSALQPSVPLPAPRDCQRLHCARRRRSRSVGATCPSVRDREYSSPPSSVRPLYFRRSRIRVLSSRVCKVTQVMVSLYMLYTLL